MEIKSFFQDFNIMYKEDGHKHCRPGWVNIPCPFHHTNNPGYHLGFNAENEYFYCWSCGHKTLPAAISKLANVPYNQAFEYIKMYGGKTHVREKARTDKKQFELPSNTSDLLQHHRKYIEKRGFDSEEIEQLFGIKSTGVYSKLDGISYKHRIVLPVFWNAEMVSFQARDVTGKHSAKYLACPLHREKVEHQTILYGLPHTFKQTGIIVEGPTDVWRFKRSTVATFGIEFTNKQIRNITRLFDRVVIIYDPEIQAQKQAKKLQKELLFRGVDVAFEHLESDPGDMKQKEADYIVKQILK